MLYIQNYISPIGAPSYFISEEDTEVSDEECIKSKYCPTVDVYFELH